MDFEYHYTTEQERFRQEVQAWLEQNVPDDLTAPVDPEDMSEEQHQSARALHKKLAAKGWLYPTYPKEYGGGGLSAEHETILEEEFLHKRVIRPFTNGLVFPTLLVWGTEEQKRKFLTPLLNTEKVAFQNFTEPSAGSDLASLQSEAVREGDDWVITGQKVFVTGAGDPDYLFGPIITDPDAPRHRNLGYFLIPVPSPGLELRRMHLLNGHNQHFIFMDNVRVPGDHLIGGDHQGWQVAQTTLEQEHGGRGQAFPRDEALDNLMTYVRETQHNGGRLGSDPIVQQETVENYITSYIGTLLAQRNYWMYQARQEMTYHGSESSMYRKTSGVLNAARARDIMGMHALLNGKDARALFKGQPEVYQRATLTALHPGGTLEIQKVIIARRIGISRTQERAAPTPATATSYSS